MTLKSKKRNQNGFMMNKISLLNEAIKYNKQLEKERALFKKYTLIQNGKMPSENFNIDMLPKIQNQQGAPVLKLISMICALDTTNTLIVEMNEIWDYISHDTSQLKLFNTYYFHRYESLCRHFIHDLKYFVDEAIGLIYITTHTEKSKIKYDCIGKYINESNKEFTIPELEPFKEYLYVLNILENSYKHSIANGEQLLMGRDEPCVFAFDAHKNDFSKSITLMGYEVAYIVNTFNEVYKAIFAAMDRVY